MVIEGVNQNDFSTWPENERRAELDAIFKYFKNLAAIWLLLFSILFVLAFKLLTAFLSSFVERLFGPPGILCQEWHCW